MSSMHMSNNFKKTPKGRWVTADFHIHSIYSDGGFTPEQILKYGSSHFLDVLAIADHSTITGALEGKTIAENHPELPVILAAQEVSAGNRFHFLLINSSKAYSEFTKDNIMDRLAEHRRSGGVIIVAHPWTMPNSKWAKSCLQDLIAAGLIDGFELFNSSSLEISEIRNVWERIWEEWIGPYQLGVLGGSDFHHLHKGRYIGTGRTYLKVYSPGEQGVIDALRAGRCVAGLFGKYHNNSVEAGILWGQEPWVTELQRFRENLQKRLTTGLKYYTPSYRKLFLNLYETGNYQFLADLL